MRSNNFRPVVLSVLAGLLLGVFLTQGFTATQVARAKNDYVYCSPKLPCTDTPTYPPKVTDTLTYPPKVTATFTYPPKVTDTNTPRPTRTRTPIPPTDTASPVVILPTDTATETATLKPTDLGATATSAPTDTPKPTVLGQTGTPQPPATATAPLLIPVFLPTPTIPAESVLPLPIPGDIWVTGMEITQATQIYGTGAPLDNSIPLVAGKKTVVRVYVQSDNFSPVWTHVTARLTVTGGPEPGRVLLPVTTRPDGSIDVSSYGSQRNIPWDSFNFVLDEDETTLATRHLAVDIFPIRPRPEINTANNHHEMDIRFVRVPDIGVYGVVYGNDGTDPHTPVLAAAPWSDFNRHRVPAENMAPVANFNILYFPGLGTHPINFPNLDAARAWADRMLAQPGYENARLYLLQPEGDCGCGYAAGRRMNGQNNLDDPGHTLAQEVAHSEGMWWHAVSPEFPADMPNLHFPYPASQIGPQVGERTFPGEILGQMYSVLPVDPSTGYSHAAHDFMSYASTYTWVSPFTYCTYMLTLTNRAVMCPPGADHASLTAPAGAGQDSTIALRRAQGTAFLYVSGQLNPDGTAALAPLEQLTSAADISHLLSGTDYHLLLQDKDGQPLKDFPFSQEETHHAEQNPTYAFNMTLPLAPGTAKVLLVKDGKTLAERDASPHAPTLGFSFDGGGQTLAGSRHFTWQAADADNDPLFYSIEYSRDGGQTWTALNVNLQQPAADINFDSLPGTDQGLLRVKASDGFNSTYAVSTGTFKVAKKAPIITSVSANQTTYQGQPVYVEVTAFDWEDGPLTDPASITWSSDLDGKLTSGRWIAPGTLSPGDHTLTATVRDSDGNTATATVNVMVLPADSIAVQKPLSLWMIVFFLGLPFLLIAFLLAAFRLLRSRKR